MHVDSHISPPLPLVPPSLDGGETGFKHSEDEESTVFHTFAIQACSKKTSTE